MVRWTHDDEKFNGEFVSFRNHSCILLSQLQKAPAAYQAPTCPRVHQVLHKEGAAILFRDARALRLVNAGFTAQPSDRNPYTCLAGGDPV